MKFFYLLVDFFTVIIPLLFSFHPEIKFYKTWKAFFPASCIVAFVFIIWDSVFINMGIWDFNPRYVTGISFLNLPVEEILFFICIPFSCVFTYYCLNKFYNLAWRPKVENIFCILFSFGLVISGLILSDKLYTAATFISTGFVCLILKFILKINWFGKAVSVYAVLLIPFLVVNGILTGSGIEEPVVRYNSSENTGIRLFTIPVEDIIYGFELMLLNLAAYLQLLSRMNSTKEEDKSNSQALSFLTGKVTHEKEPSK